MSLADAKQCVSCCRPMVRKYYPNTPPKWFCQSCNAERSRQWSRNAGQRRRDKRKQQIADGCTKTCDSCGLEKLIADFYANCGRAGDGSTTSCKQCIVERAVSSGRSHKLESRYAELKRLGSYRGFDVTISIDEFRELMEQDSCDYCGGPLPIFGFGIDRMNSNLGYVPGNCVPCCYACNTFKNKHFTYEEMKILGGVIATILESRGEGSGVPAYSLYGEKA